MVDPQLMFGARRLVTHCCDVQPGEEALVIIDAATDPVIADALAQAVRELNANCTTLRTQNAKADSGEPPAEVAAAMEKADVIFTAVQVSLTHTEATKAACARGGRVAALTQWVPEMLRGGGIEADFRAIEPTVRTVAAAWDTGSEVRVTTAAGTDMVLDIRGRLGTPHAKTCVVRPGTFHPIPDIESPVSPVTGSGIIVCDASIPYLGIGLLTEPVTLTVENGTVTSISGGAAADTVRAAWEAFDDPNVYHLAELGIGMNPRARLTGRMLDDEGVATTCHFGIGTSNTLGGFVKAKCHYDFVLHDPTITVDGRAIMLGGALQV
jgi:leucyl aminopeptidase (aminopeptidase T)